MNRTFYMSVLLLTAGPLSAAPEKKESSESVAKKKDFNKMMREVWSDHGVWTREYIVAATTNAPSVKVATERLLKNQEDIGQTLVPFYGKEAAQKLTDLLKEHIVIAGELVDAAKKNSTTSFKKADKKWHKNADDISTFLSKANPYIKFDSMKDMLYEHLKLTTEEVNGRIKKQWADDVQTYDTVRKQLNSMADELSQALTKAFPEKFI